MKKALIFPGQGSQKPGMGADLYEGSALAKELFGKANEVLGFDIAGIMFGEDADALRKTSVTQPAIYIHSMVQFQVFNLKADMVAGHSLGEFSALTAANVLSFEDGLKLVSIRAEAMQKACDAAPSTMAAIVGLDDAIVEEICAGIPDVVPANYNSPGQLVISGSSEGIALAVTQAKEAGAKIAKEIPVAGAFHSPFMQPAKDELEAGIQATSFKDSLIPIYQNVTALPETQAEQIKANLVQQLTSPVKWTQTVRKMIADGTGSFTEVGPGRVLQGLVKRIDRSLEIKGNLKLETLDA